MIKRRRRNLVSKDDKGKKITTEWERGIKRKTQSTYLEHLREKDARVVLYHVWATTHLIILQCRELSSDTRMNRYKHEQIHA